MGRWRGRQDGAEDELLRLLRAHAAELLRFARRFSLCADDAQDAYQRSMEILLRRMRDEPPDNPLSWLRTVLRHEALAVREQRLRDVGRDELDLDRHQGRELDDPADRAERFEQLAHAAEALRRLKPQEVTALVLRAEGLSYQEICARTGWSYTRCNRSITEGRRALIARMNAIETGAECERWVPLLSLLADGEASARDLAELRPHLRSCRPCRVTLRGFYEAPRQIGALVPAALLPVSLAGVGSGGFGVGRQLEALVHALSERATAGAMRMQSALDALPATKVAAVAASTAAIAGGGAAIEQVATGAGERGGGGSPSRAIAASAGAGAARQLFATGPATSPIVQLPGTTSRATAADPRSLGLSTARPSRAADEFGFETGAIHEPRDRERRQPASAARAARHASAARGAPGRASTPTRPAEFHAPPTSGPASAASTAAPASPPAAAAAPAPAPREQAPPEFAGP